jgi:ketosteroid isomerase-like protein
MSEQENTQQVHAIFEGFARGDIPFILDQLTDDVRFVSHLEPVVPWAGDYSGKPNVPKFFEALGSAAGVTAPPRWTRLSHKATPWSRGAASTFGFVAPARRDRASGLTSGGCGTIRSTATNRSTIQG